MILTNRDYANLCRKALMIDISKIFGDLIIEGIWFKSSHNENKILALYSNLNDDRWFYGIDEKDWGKFNNNTYIAFLMRDGKNCSYALLTPTESINLISKINLSKDKSKKINVRIPAAGKIYIQEWQDFAFVDRIRSIGNINPEEAIFEKLVKKYGVEFLRKALIEAKSKS